MRERIEAAAARLSGRVRETPVERSPALEANGIEVWLKLENLQITGSFKLRGALNKLLVLTPEARAGGVVAASSGNHGAAVAYGAALLGCGARVFVPVDASPVKVAAIRSFGAEVEEHGDDSVESERAARRYADERGLVYVSPYNDEDVIAGQGTIGAELEAQAGAFDVVYVALGGGGLVGGIGAYLKALRPSTRVVACSPAASAVMAHSLESGRLLDEASLPTLSDGTAGGVEENAITFPLCRSVVDRCVLVSEDEIASAMRLVMERHHTLVEGAGAVAVAGYLKDRERLDGGRAAIILCGANVSLATLRRVLAG